MPVASLCSQAASNSIITLFRVSDQRYPKKKKTAFLDSRILPKKSNSLNLFEGKKYGTFDQSGTPRPDTACLVHHWLSSFNLSFNQPPPTWPCIYIQDHASSFISVLSLVHYPDEYQAYCPRWIIHIDVRVSSIIFLLHKKHEKIFSYSLGILRQRYFFCIITSQMIAYQVEGDCYIEVWEPRGLGTPTPPVTRHETFDRWVTMKGFNYTTLTALSSSRFSSCLLLLHLNKSSSSINSVAFFSNNLRTLYMTLC